MTHIPTNNRGVLSDLPANTVVLRGALSACRSTFALPEGGERNTHTLRSLPDADDSWSVPVVVEVAAGHCNEAWDEGVEVCVVGHVRQRFFRSGSVTVSRTEVVADRIIPLRRRRQVERALEQVRRSLGAA